MSSMDPGQSIKKKKEKVFYEDLELPSPNVEVSSPFDGQYVKVTRQTFPVQYKPVNIQITPEKKRDVVVDEEEEISPIEARYNASMRETIHNPDDLLNSMLSPPPKVQKRKKRTQLEKMFKKDRPKKSKRKNENSQQRRLNRGGPLTPENLTPDFFSQATKRVLKKNEREKSFLVSDFLHPTTEAAKKKRDEYLESPKNTELTEKQRKKRFQEMINKRVQMKLQIIEKEKKSNDKLFQEKERIRKRCNDSLYSKRINITVRERKRLKLFLHEGSKNEERWLQREEERRRKQQALEKSVESDLKKLRKKKPSPKKGKSKKQSSHQVSTRNQFGNKQKQERSQVTAKKKQKFPVRKQKSGSVGSKRSNHQGRKKKDLFEVYFKNE